MRLCRNKCKFGTHRNSLPMVEFITLAEVICNSTTMFGNVVERCTRTTRWDFESYERNKFPLKHVTERVVVLPIH